MKMRTTDNLFTFIVTAALVSVPLITILAIIVPTVGAKIALSVFVVVYASAAVTAILLLKKRFVMNYIDDFGIRNEFFGEEYCSMKWRDVNDWGTGRSKRGDIYIFISGAYVVHTVRNDILRMYNPSNCILIPYSEVTVEAVRDFSDGKIDLVGTDDSAMVHEDE